MVIRHFSLTVLTLFATVVAGLSGCATTPVGGILRFGGPRATPSDATATEKDGAVTATDGGNSDATETGMVSAKAEPMETPSGGTRNAGDPDPEGQGQPTSASSAKDDAVEARDLTIQSLIAELEASQPLEPETKQRLIDDLQRTPPHLWPAVVQLFRATLAYRRTEASRGVNTGSPANQAYRNDAAVVQAALQSPAVTDSVRPDGIEAAVGRPSDVRRSESFAQPQATAADVRLDVAPAIAPAVAVMPPPTGGAGRPATATVPGSGAGHGGTYSGTLPGVSSLSAPSRISAASEGVASGGSPRPAFPGVEDAGDHLSPASPEQDWRYLVNSARWQLESRVKTASGGSNLEDELRLRLLNLALADREGAVRPVAGLPPPMQDFWSKTFFGLSLMITDPPGDGLETGTVSALETQRYLQDALQRLQETCPLEIRNPAFVTAVQSWGVYDPFEKNEFSPGRQVLLYAEIENLTSESTAKGYRTSWQSSYRIFDENGRVAADYQYPPNEEYCRRVRRDFFIGCELSIPAQL
ncbi:MAG: hypothetical protein GYA33_03085, partial [Thermogutta sp.]|nr:hypothetical protein [Thermogutta sp.]